MLIEFFLTEQEFYSKYPSKFYICSNCGYVGIDKYSCQNCGWRADGLFKTLGKGYKYAIIKTRMIFEIFRPLERRLVRGYKKKRNRKRN